MSGISMNITKAGILRGGIAALLIVTVIGAAGFASREWISGREFGAKMPTSPEIEAQWGARFTQVAVTADGGLLDVRFIAIDGDKAKAMLDIGNPALIVERNGAVLNSTAMMPPRHDLTTGRSFFVLFNNSGGSITPGTAVTIRVGGLKLEHVRAQ